MTKQTPLTERDYGLLGFWGFATGMVWTVAALPFAFLQWVHWMLWGATP